MMYSKVNGKEEKHFIESVNIILTDEIIHEINEIQKYYPNPCP